MTDDDNDRTQEIRRDGDRYAPSHGQGGTSRLPQDSGGPTPDRRDDTAVFGRPEEAAPRREAPSDAARPGATQRPGAYPPPGGGYRPAPGVQSAQPYGAAPLLPTDRGSGGFPAAIVGAVVATLLAVATCFGAYQILKNHSSIDPGKPLGFVTYRMNLLTWPFDGGSSDLTTAFVVGGLLVLVITLLLMMAATMSTRAGTGGFAVFLAGWMATVIAGGVARPIVGAIARQGSAPSGVWQTDLSVGVQWGVVFGWIAALVLVIMHAMRRKPVTR